MGESNGASLRIAFTNGTDNVSGIHSGYLVTGFWLVDQAEIELPDGIDDDDVMVAYFNGSSYEVLKAKGGTEADGAAVDGEGKWHTVSISQDPAIDSLPRFTLDGVELEPVPLENTIGEIDGLEFGSNGGFASQAYVDAPLSGAPLVITDVTRGRRQWSGDVDVEFEARRILHCRAFYKSHRLAGRSSMASNPPAMTRALRALMLIRKQPRTTFAFGKNRSDWRAKT